MTIETTALGADSDSPGDWQPVPAPAELVTHHLQHRAFRREFADLPALLAAVPGADPTVRVRVIANARDVVAMARAHHAPGVRDEVDELLGRTDADLDSAAPDLAGLARRFARLAELTAASGWCAMRPGRPVLPRRRRTAWLGRMLADATAADRETVLAAVPWRLRTAWRLGGARRYRREVAVLAAIAAGRLRRGPDGTSRGG